MAGARNHAATADRELLEFARGPSAADQFRPRRPAHLILLAVTILIVCAVGWAAWARLDEVTRGEGRVIPSRQVQVVQNLEGGIVAEILVREGQIVEEDEILMRIDNVQAASEYREKRARYLSLRASVARLQAEVEETAPAFSAEILNEARDIAQNEQALFNRRQEQLQYELEVLQEQRAQRQQELNELETRRDRARQSLALAREELELTEPLAEQRIVSRTDFLKLKREVNELAGTVEEAELAIPRAEAAIREAHGNIEGAVSRFHSDAQRELNIKKSELSALRETVAAGEDQVRRTAVRSPVRGTVKQLNLNTIGGVIRPGEDIFEIVPLEDNLLIEAQIRPSDIAFLRPGLPAKVKITAYDFAIYGALDGTLENISADTIENDDGDSVFEVTVRTDGNLEDAKGETLVIIPGMTAQVDILTGDKTVLDYLMQPVLRVRDRALRER